MAESYVGTLISLTTNSDIRYEGFVFHINQEQLIIGLRNVKLVGTEGRRKDGPQVPPSKGVYKHVYFKGTEIKDLHVQSSPLAESTFDVPDDPAIVQMCEPLYGFLGFYTHVKSSPLAQSTFDVPDDPAIVQSYITPPASSPVRLSTSGDLQKTNISRNAESAVHTPYSPKAVSLGSTLSPLTLDNSKPAISPTYWPSFHHLPSLSQCLIVSHASQQQTDSSLMNVHLATNSSNFQPHHSLIQPITPGAQNGLHADQKSPVCCLSKIPSMISVSAIGSQTMFPPIGPGVQSSLCPVPQTITIGSPRGIPLVTPRSATSSNGFPPVPPLSATYYMTPLGSPCSQNSLQPVGPFSAIGSPDGLPSLPSSSATSSRAGFQPLALWPTTYSPIPPLSPGSQSGLRPVTLFPVTGYPDALHSLPPSSAAVNGFSLAPPPITHSDAGLFTLPAFNTAPSLLSNITFSGPSTPADLKTPVASSSSASHVNTVTTSGKEVATSVSDPVAPCSSMILSVMPTAETRSDFVGNNPLQPSDPLLQQEQIRFPSSHHLRIINDYDPVQVSASVTLSSGSMNVKEPLQQIPKPQATKVQGATSSSQFRKTYHSQRPRDEKDRDVLQGRHSDRCHGKGKAKLPNGAVLHTQHDYRSYAKARRHEPNEAVLHTQHGYRSHAKARRHEASHRSKIIGGDCRSNGFLLSTRRLGRGYPSGETKVSLPVEKFTEDFNFEAMNEKFKKEKVWGLLGESTAAESEHKNEDAEAVEGGPVTVDNKPVYCKDDFFDTLSSNTVDQQTGRGRVKFSERRRIDNETFGEIKKHQRGRGIQGPRRAGGSQGSYGGRGYDDSGMRS